MQLKITLALPPRILSPNVHVGTRGSRMAFTRAVKKYRTAAKIAVLSQYPMNYKPRWKSANVQIVWYAKRRQWPDGDNAVATMKSAYDGITDAGLFHNDRGLTHLPFRKELDAAKPRIEILIEPTLTTTTNAEQTKPADPPRRRTAKSVSLPKPRTSQVLP